MEAEQCMKVLYNSPSQMGLTRGSFDFFVPIEEWSSEESLSSSKSSRGPSSFSKSSIISQRDSAEIAAFFSAV